MRVAWLRTGRQKAHAARADVDTLCAMRASWLLKTLIPLALLGCDEGIGGDGTQIPLTLEEMSGGVVFATWVIEGANGYDLFWAPLQGVGSRDPIQLTTTNTDDNQPSLAGNGSAIAFARRERGIHLIRSDGTIRQISDTEGTSFVDTLPAVSFDGDRVAWVRENTRQQIGSSGLFETAIWVANADGSNARAINPKSEVIQDAPAFEPATGSSRLAWSEFNATTLGRLGPTSYGVWVHDLDAFSGRFACSDRTDVTGGPRCFGQHLAWPEPRTLVLGQQMLEIDPATGPRRTLLGDLLDALASQPGAVDRAPSLSGFFPPFPLSTHYAGGLMIMDGLFLPVDGNQPGLTFFVANAPNAATPQRFEIPGFQSDFDPQSTAGYLFSLATPQLIP